MDTPRDAAETIHRGWRWWWHAGRLILRGATWHVALPIALVVGSALVLVNQAAELLSGEADVATALRVAANYAIPFLVSSVGYLSARPAGTAAPPPDPPEQDGSPRRTTVTRMTSEPTDPGGSARPTLILFDVNETLSDMSPMGQRFEDIGAPAHLAKTWFAGLLRDGFALTAVAASEKFATIAAESLRVSLHGLSLSRGTEDAVQHVMDGFAGLQVHPDVPDGIRALAGAGLRLATLSNGSASVAEALLDRAGIRDRFEVLLSVEGAGIWKPAAGAYRYGVEQCGVEPADAMLVAVHPWDIDGAARAGLATAWINRAGAPYPGYFRSPDLTRGSLTQLAERLG